MDIVQFTMLPQYVQVAAVTGISLDEWTSCSQTMKDSLFAEAVNHYEKTLARSALLLTEAFSGPLGRARVQGILDGGTQARALVAAAELQPSEKAEVWHVVLDDEC